MELERALAGQDAIGVGIIGAGMVVQAIHVPVLEGLRDHFAIRGLWDPVSARAESIAGRLGARAVGSLEELLDDPAIDVVAICSPASFHAHQALAAMRAGKRAVLVEKPLCATLAEAEAILGMASRTGTALFVGSMHLYDPAWLAARDIVAIERFVPGLIRSSIILPNNARFEAWSTEPLTDVPPASPAGSMKPEHLMRLCILELAIHDLPLIRRLLPETAQVRVVSASLLEPFGYGVGIDAGGVLIDLFGLIHGHWQPDWTLEATGREGQMQIAFTPSFVSAGSGTMQWSGAGRSESRPSARGNGYLGEWRAIAACLRGDTPKPDPCEVTKDFGFALAIAEQASELVAAEGRP